MRLFNEIVIIEIEIVKLIVTFLYFSKDLCGCFLLYEFVVLQNYLHSLFFIFIELKNAGVDCMFLSCHIRDSE